MQRFPPQVLLLPPFVVSFFASCLNEYIGYPVILCCSVFNLGVFDNIHIVTDFVLDD